MGTWTSTQGSFAKSWSGTSMTSSRSCARFARKFPQSERAADRSHRNLSPRRTWRRDARMRARHGGSTGTDTGTIVTDTGGGGPEGGPSQGGTTGSPCTTTTDCDKLGDAVQGCSSDVGFTLGTLYPTPVCIGTTCTPDTSGAIGFCDGLLGICLPVTGGGICLPTCTFTSTSAPTGCRGKDACNVYGWDSASDPKGYGYCFGGC